MIRIGSKVRSTMNSKTGYVVGYGALSWPASNNINGDGGILHLAYVVQVEEGSSALAPACAVFRADRVEEVA
jgi:hypothetical protein